MQTKITKNLKDVTKKVGVGAVVAGLTAATVAVSYFLYGPKGEKNRKKLKGWMLKMKGEVLQKMEDLKEVNKETYEKLVDTIGEKYKNFKETKTEDVEELVKKLKSHWPKIEKDISPKKKTILKKKK